MKFTYLAKTNEGVISKGEIEAASQKDAKETLSKRDLTPISIKKDTSSQNFFSKISEKLTFIPLSEKVIFTRQLATLISAGVPIAQAMHILNEETENKRMKNAISQISVSIEGGNQLSDSFSSQGKIFTPLFINMVKAGEVGGILDDSLQRAAVEMEKEHELASQIRGAMIYPVAVLVLTVGVLIFMLTYLVPQMAQVFISLGTGKMPQSIQTLISISNVLKNYGIFIFAGIVIAIYLTRRALAKNKKFRLAWHKLLLKIPVFGKLIKKINISRFTRTLSSLLSSGVTVLEAMKIAADSLKSEVYKTEIENAIEDIKGGKTIADSLRKSKHFPAVVVQTIAVGEETGSIDKILMKITEYYESEVMNLTKGLSDLIMPVMMIVIGVVVGLMFYSIIVPLSQISDYIQ